MEKKINDQYFTWSPISIEQDMAMLMNASKYSCDLEPVYESPQEFNYRQSLWTAKRPGRMSSLTVGLLTGAGMAFIPVFTMIGTQPLPLVLSLNMMGLSGLSGFCMGVVYHIKYSSNRGKRYTLKIDSNNCKNYQIRMLTDNKIYIICNPNFDTKNQLIDSNIIAEVPLKYSDLIVIDRIKEFEENDAGIHIRADVTVRAYDEQGATITYQQNSKPVDMDIFVQKGIFPIELLQHCSQVYPIYNRVTLPRNRYLMSTVSPQYKPVWHIDFPSDNTPGLELCKHFFCHDRSIKHDQFVQYFRDEYGYYYKIQFIKSSTNADDLFASVEELTQGDLVKVMDKKWGYYYVKRFMAGYGDCSVHGYGEAWVVPLPDFTLVERGTRYNKFTYTEDGKTKILKVSNDFVGLADEFILYN